MKENIYDSKKLLFEIKEYLRYEKDTGCLYWIKSTRRDNKIIGKLAGHKDNRGYLSFSIKYKVLKVHRVIWLFEHGEMPKNQIDHINGNKSDNRISNLRDVNHRENVSNLKKHREGKLVGATYKSKINKWQSRININKKQFYLGVYETERLAHEQYLKAKNNIEKFEV